MKLTTFLLLISLIQVSAASFGQKVTLKAGETTVNNIFKEIRKQTGYSVMLDKANFKTERKVTANFNNASIQLVMDQVLEGTGFSYVIEDKNIIVEQKEKSLIERIVDRISAIDVSGKVLDSDGRPLPGATVTVRGTKISTTTQNDGSFTLKGVSDDAVLVITYMGFEAKELKVERNIGSVRLIASTNPLDEVQVIAYGTTTRRLSTGNVTTIKAKDIENQPITNPLLALQGRVPGLVITQNTGVPGGGVTVRIQGQNSMNSGNTPLYVVDGVPIESHLPFMGTPLIGNSGSSEVPGGTEGNPLSYLNPSDIESIDVLKDADATAIYGSRAANGAILITSKKGKTGKMQLETNFNSGIGKVSFNNFKMLNTRQYLDMRYAAFRNDGIDWRNSDVNAPDLKLWDTTRYTDWKKELMGGAMHSQNFRASISGGSTNINYRLAGTYSQTSSIFPDNGNGNPIISFSSNINSISANQKLRMSWSANYQYNHNELPAANFLDASWLLPPNAPNPFNADGTINWAPNANGNSTFLANPFVGMTQVHKNTTTNLVSNLSFGYQLLNNLELSGNLGFTNLLTENFSPYPSTTIQPELRSNFINHADYGDRNLKSWIVEPQLTYKKQTDQGRFDILLGGSFRESRAETKVLNGFNYPSDELLDNILLATTITSPGIGLSTQYKYLAYFGRFSYNLEDQIILNFNIRRDGSSRFGENKRFSNFWSAGGAWLLNNYAFIKDAIPWLSFGKLRASYGITGNDQIGDYKFIRTYLNYPLQVPYQGIGALQSRSLPNPELAWERVKKLSTGIDLGIFDDRILLSLNYSKNSSDNQLSAYPLSTVTGNNTMDRNLNAKVRNSTWEFTLNTVNLQKDKLQWSTMLNLSLAKNVLVDYPNLAQSPFANQYVIGQPLDMVRISRFGGINSATGEYQFLDKNGNVTTFPSFPDDYLLRSFYPTTYGGIQNTIRWDKLTLDFFIQVTKKYGTSLQYSNGTGGITPGVFLESRAGQPLTVLNYWQKPGDVATIAKPSTIPFNSSSYIIGSDEWYKDTSFARLKNVSLSWEVPQKWATNIGIRSCKITGTAQNVLTLTNYYGPDPETSGLNVLPPVRMITFGIQIIL